MLIIFPQNIKPEIIVNDISVWINPIYIGSTKIFIKVCLNLIYIGNLKNLYLKIKLIKILSK